jgi:hypothetical protein
VSKEDLMPDTKKSSSGSGARHSMDASSSAKPPGASVAAAYEEYQKSLLAAAARAQRQCNDARAEYLRAISDAQREGQRGQEDAFRTYSMRIQEARESEGATRLGREAEQNFMDGLEKLAATVRQRSQEAERKALEAVQGANDAASKAWQEARTAYVRNVQEQIARLDPESLQPETLAAFGQSLLAAACAIGATTRRP